MPLATLPSGFARQRCPARWICGAGHPVSGDPHHGRSRCALTCHKSGPGAQLINNGTDNGHYDIVFGSVSPSEAARFYTTALPRAGYTITSNSSAAGESFSGTGIWFTGHGYNGQIGALSSFHISGISFGANTVEITLTPQ